MSVYLFTGGGAYQGKNAVTDNYGRVTFDLPDKAYEVRADYLGQQFWSGPFTSNDAGVVIPHGTATIRVTDNGLKVQGANVYLFTNTGAYLGKYEVTDENGEVSFFIPAGAYKFRVDTNGAQHWSDTTDIPGDTETIVPVSLNPLALDWIPPDPMNDNAQEMEPVFLASLFESMGLYPITRPLGKVALPGLQKALR